MVTSKYAPDFSTLTPMPPAAKSDFGPFNYVQETRHVAFNVNMRIVNRVAHSGLSRKMHDALEFFD